MRWFIVCALLLTVFTAGCSGGASNQPVSTNPFAEPGFAMPEPGTWVDLMKPVQEYFHLRKRAIITGDMAVLWARYPELKDGMDDGAGINVERTLAARYPGTIVDGNVFPEDRARMVAKLAGDSAEVILHGTEVFVHNAFDTAGGEFVLKLYLQRRNGAWTVVKTDEVTLAEYHQKVGH